MHPALRHYYYYSAGEALPHDDVYAAYGTDFDDLLLPEGVTWEEGDYDPLTEGTYEISGSGGNTVNVHLEKYILKLDPSNLYTMLQEGRGGTPVTDVTADAQNVGTIYDLGKGLVFNAATNFPTLTSSAAFNSFVTSGSTAATLICQLHRQYFKPLHAVSPTYCIRYVWKFESGSDGVFTTMLRTRVSSGAGINLARMTDNTLRFLMYNSAGTIRINFTTVQTVNVASGAIWVTINVNGTGASAGAMHIKTESGVDVSETFTVNSGTDISMGGNDFEIFVAGNQSMGALQIMPRIATAGEITAWKTYNPSRHSTPFLIKNRSFNPSNAATMFSDAAGTTPSTDGGIIRFASDDVVSPGGPMPGFLAAADASAPVWVDNAGVSYADYDEARNLAITGYLTPEYVGRSTIFIVARNDDADLGSHFLAAGGSSDTYMVQVGANYTGNPGTEKPYMVIHPTNGFGETIGTIPAFAGDNVYVWIRDKTSNKLLNNSLTDYFEDTNGDAFRAENMGNRAFAELGWNIDGRIYKLYKYSGVMPEARALAIRNELKTIHGIS